MWYDHIWHVTITWHDFSQKKPGQEQPVTIHPAVKGLLGKAPLDPARRPQGDLSVTPPTATDARALPGIREEKGNTGTSKEKQIHTSPVPRKSQEVSLIYVV